MHSKTKYNTNDSRLLHQARPISIEMAPTAFTASLPLSSKPGIEYVCTVSSKPGIEYVCAIMSKPGIEYVCTVQSHE
ncbi:hypothetical protein B0A54_07233 [Friedmanniomyces endolithicus]|uniref:Uncharacterized protein n=1 Tax=Friedmanniomyces endolithicus TaxID=329885 RepID=A0A4U0V397_9PEZI|nr:hypothetical protein B0A54_07233 [Friedmanniomyces endolithicus]